MHHTHHAVFVILSLVVAVLGSWTALDLFRRVRTHVGTARHVWLTAASVGMGLSIWSMHFVAMLGFDPGTAVSYAPSLTFLSLILAIGATSGAFFFAAQGRRGPVDVLVAGTAMGAGICLMHYVGMAAVRTSASITYDPRLVGLSLVIAIVASTAALILAQRESSFARRAVTACTLGAAIVGMHYTAMAALRLGLADGAAHAPAGAPPVVLGVAVSAGTLLILFLALMASLYDQRVNVLSAVEAGGVGYWELVLPDNVLHLSPRAKQIYGAEPDAPFGLEELTAALPADEQPGRLHEFELALATGEYDVEHRLKDNRWVNIRGRVTHDARGRPRRMIGVVLDVTDRHEAFAAVARSDARQRLLINELNHRVKNTLATIQSIAAQTGRRANSLSDFWPTFEARLIALSATHDALTRGNWEQASLRELLGNELSPHAPEQIRLAGPDLELRQRHALALGMVFHELATNAAKYGALSCGAGRVTVDWSVAPESEGQDMLSIVWSESGGPLVAPPTRAGFGSRLIRGSIERELGGSATLTYAAEGFHCLLQLPLTAATRTEAALTEIDS